MDISTLPGLVDAIPGWGWIVIIIFVLFVLGERIVWDYEVKFPYKQAAGRGEVELECGSKKGTRIKCRFELEEFYREKPIEIRINNQTLHTIDAGKNQNGKVYIREHIAFQQPTEGDEVVVLIGNDEVFTGVLVLD